MFENLNIKFHRNVSECTKVGGYLLVHVMMGLKYSLCWHKTNESKQIIEDGKKMWEVTKRYDRKMFKSDSTSLGYAIDVYQESINKTFREFLVNFDYLDRMMDTDLFLIR